MRRSFNTGLRRARITIATLLVVALAFILYYLKYVPKREQLVNERNFRSLHQLESNIQSKKQNLFSVTSTYFKKIDRSTPKRSNGNVLATDDVFRQPENLSYAMPDGALVFSRLDSTTRSEFLLTKDEINIDGRGDSSNLVITKRVTSSDTPAIHYRIRVMYPIFQFMKSLVNRDFFENYVIVHNGSIIYKSGFTDLDSIKRDSIIPGAQGIISSGIRDISLAGNRYKLFILPFRLDNTSTSYLYGLTPLEVYNNDKFHLPDGIIVAVAFLILFLLLALPFFKILLISNMERLNTMDVLSSFLTLTFGCSLFILVLLGGYFHNGLDFQSRETSLKLLHSDIDSSLISEIDSATRQIESYSNLLMKYAGNDLVSKPNGELEPFSNRSGTNKLKAPLPDPQPSRKLPYKYVIWFDSAGNELFSFTTDTVLPPKTNYATRRYFQMVKEKNLWSLPTNPKESFFLDGVYSYTSGQFRSTVSVPVDTVFEDANGNRVHTMAAVLTGNFRSVVDPLLPPGFGFCIMEENGNVLFHSDTRKNLQEDFLSECDRNPHLLAILHSQQSGCFYSNYQGKNYRMYAAPIGGQIPLYLITFYNQPFFTGTYVQTFEYSSILAFINVLLVILMTAVTFISQYRRNKVKKSLVDIEWLWPYKNKILVYYFNLLSNLVLAIALVLIFTFSDNEFLKLSLVGFNSLFAVGFFFVSNHANESLRTFRKLFPQFIICSVFLFLLMNGIAIILLPSASIYLGFVLYQVSVCIFGWGCLSFLHKTFVRSTNKEPLANAADNDAVTPSNGRIALLSHRFNWVMKTKFSTAYCLMLVSWIVTVSIIPAFLFFQLAYNRENEILMKNSQVETVIKKNDLVRKYTLTGDSLRYVQNDRLPSNNFLSDFQSTRFITGIASDTLCVSCGGATTVNFLYRFFATGSRFPHNDVCISDNLLYLPCDKNQTYYWCYCNPWMIMQYRSPGSPGSPAFIESKLPSFSMPDMFVKDDSGKLPVRLNISFFIFWISLFFFLWIITQVIMYFARELFAFDFFPDQKLVLTGEEAIENIQSHQSPGEQQHLFITSLPLAVPLEKFLEIAKDLQAGGKAQLVDCAQLTPDKIPAPLPGSSIVILQNLDFDISGKETNDLRLQLVQSILSTHSRCILLSTRSASDFIETLSLSSFEQPTGASENRDEWTFILSNFAQVYFPLQSFNYVHSLPLSPNLDRFLEEECSHGIFLKGVQLTLMHSMPAGLAEDLAGDEIKLIKYKDEVTLKVQSIASPYYRSIWASLSNAEKHVLFDIAQDGLVNTKNVRFINRLLNKGLLLYDNHLRIMNESFRNFILTGVGAVEISQLNRDVRNSGTWSRLRTPLLLIIAGVLIFMFATQQDIFNKTMLWVGTIIGALATLSRVFSFLPASSSSGTSEAKSS